MVVLKILLTLISWGAWIYVIFAVPYPDNLTQASVFQLSAFFIPLFLALTLTFNFLFKNIPSSIISSFGILLLLILKALQALNFLSALITLAAVLLLLSYFQGLKNLTLSLKIPRLKSLRRKRR